MPVGLEVYNDYGQPQTIDGSFNLVLVEKGTVSIGSNTAATGSSGSRALPARDSTYLVFIRCSGNAIVTSMGAAAFGYHMAQGTTSFQYWAYNKGTAGGNAGMQCFNADGSLRWNLGERPLTISSVQRPGGSVPFGGTTSSQSVWAGPAYGIPSGHAVMLSDPGLCGAVYYVPGYPLTLNMTHYPCINTSAGSSVQLNWCRRRANLTSTGSLPSGISQVGQHTQNPAWIVTAPAI